MKRCAGQAGSDQPAVTPSFSFAAALAGGLCHLWWPEEEKGGAIPRAAFPFPSKGNCDPGTTLLANRDPHNLSRIAGEIGEQGFHQIGDQFGQAIGARDCLSIAFKQALARGHIVDLHRDRA